MSDLFSAVDTRTVAFPLQVAGIVLGIVVLAGIVADVAVLGRLRRRPPDSPDLKERLAGLPWGWRESILVGLVLAACFLLVQTLAAALDFTGLTAAADFVIRMQTLVFQAATAAAVLFVLRVRRLSWRDAFGFDRSGGAQQLGQGLALYLAAMPAVAFYALAWLAVLRFLGLPLYRQPVIDILGDPNQPVWFRAYLVVLAVGTAPLVEEILFRGIALPTVARRLPLLPAVCLVSLLFACIHGNTASVVPLFVFGMALALAYAYTGSLLVPVVMHTLFNAISLAMLFLLRGLPEWIGK